ncbi:MAG: tRNA adenosine(34) deaminase TadA [Planctomycetota bacterium]
MPTNHFLPSDEPDDDLNDEPGNDLSDLANAFESGLLGEQSHLRWMRLALEEAHTAAAEDEVPVGAIVVAAGRVVASAHNQREQLADPTAHAEMIALTQAAAALGSWRLEGCTLYVTLEPCPMCAGAILQARVPFVVWGAPDPKAGAVESLYRLFEDPRLNHRVDHTGRVLADECGQILKRFFRGKRTGNE